MRAHKRRAVRSRKISSAGWFVQAAEIKFDDFEVQYHLNSYKRKIFVIGSAHLHTPRYRRPFFFARQNIDTQLSHVFFYSTEAEVC